MIMPSAVGLPACLWDTQDVSTGNTVFFGEKRLDDGNVVPGNCSTYATEAGARCFVEVGTVFRLSKLSAEFLMVEESERKDIARYMERCVLTFEMVGGRELLRFPANELYAGIEAFKTLEYSINPLLTFAALSVFKATLKTPFEFVGKHSRSFTMRLLLTGWKIDHNEYLTRRMPVRINGERG